MIKRLSWRFREYLGGFHMLTVKACSETALSRDWFNQFFQICNLGNTLAMTIIFFFQNLENLMEILEMEERNQ